MTQKMNTQQTTAAAFANVAQADEAIHRLLAAGFTAEHLAVIGPARYKDQLLRHVAHVDSPTADPEGTLVAGSAVGATLGGLAVAATVLTGGVAGIAGAVALIGGGAIAGGFSSLIVEKGYEQERDDDYKQAIERGQIVVGVEIPADHGSLGTLSIAQGILADAGGRELPTLAKPTLS